LVAVFFRRDVKLLNVRPGLSKRQELLLANWSKPLSGELATSPILPFVPLSVQLHGSLNFTQRLLSSQLLGFFANLVYLPALFFCRII
jgi:hypothetical protein